MKWKEKKILIAGVFILSLLSCKVPQPPNLSVKPESYEGGPKVIQFVATGETTSEKAEITGYQYEITFPDESTKSLFSADGVLNYEFGAEGEYSVSVIVADSLGSSTDGVTLGEGYNPVEPVVIPVAIESPYKNSSWAFTGDSVYLTESVGLDASMIPADEYEWYILQPSIDPNEDSDGDSFADIPVFSASGPTVDVEGCLPEVKEGYLIRLIVKDAYGNTKTFTDSFDVKSEDDPTAAAEVLLADGSDITIESPAYEYAPILLSSADTQAGLSTDYSITKVVWNIFKDDYFITQSSADTAGALAYTPGAAGVYTFRLKVTNNLGNVDELSAPLSVLISENSAEVTSFSALPSSGSIIYDGIPVTLDVSADSVSSRMGEIVKILWDFQDVEIADVSYEIASDSTDYSHSWTPANSCEAGSNQTYIGEVSVVNAAGRKSLPVPFGFTVNDNSPTSGISVSASKVFWGNSIVVSAAGGTPDADFSTSIVLTDASNIAVAADAGGSDSLKTFTPPIEGKDLTSSENYKAVVRITSNVSGKFSESEAIIQLVEAATIAVFEPKFADGCSKYYSKQKIVLDASGSMDLDGNAISDTDFQWSVNGTPVSLEQIGGGQFFLELNEAGVYEVFMTITGSPGAVCSRTILAVDNTPSEIEISMEPVGEVENPDGSTSMSYKFTALAGSPDGSPVTFDWYNDVVPVGGATPTELAADSVVFAYQGGFHTVYVSATNESGYSAIKSITFETADYIAPVAPKVLALTPTKNDKPLFSWTSDESVDGFRYQVGSQYEGGWSELTTEYSYAPVSSLNPDNLAALDVTLYVQSVDAAGNWSESGSFTVSIDNESPAAPIISAPSLETCQVRPTWSWDPADEKDADGYRWQLDGESGSWNETSAQTYTSLDALSAGDHILYVQTKDEVGNWSDSGSLKITIDLVAPQPPTVEGDAKIGDMPASWSWTPDDSLDTAGYRYQLNSEDGAGWTEVSDLSYAASSALPSGGYVFYVQTRDVAGNWSVSGSFTTLVDTTPPVKPNVNSAPFTNDTTPTWTWSIADAETAGFRYQLDSEAGSWNIVTLLETEYTAPVLSSGDHFLYVQACDEMGNWSESTVSKVNIDFTPPTPPVVSVNRVIYNTTVTWSWNEDVETTGYRVQLNSESGAWTILGDVVSHPQVVAVEGDNTLYVQAKDAAGNWSSSGSAKTTCGTPAVALVGETNLSVPYTGTYTESGFNVSVGGVDVTSLVNQLFQGETIDSRVSGVYQLDYTSEDSLGVAMTMASRYVTVDPPVAPVITNPRFEDADNGNCPGWSWYVNAYAGGSGLSYSWIGAMSSNGGAIQKGGAVKGSGTWAIVTRVEANTHGCDTSVNHPFDSEDGVPGRSNSAYIAGSHRPNTYYIARTRGSLTYNSDIPVLANVSYKFSGLTYLGDVRDGNIASNSVFVSGQNGLTFVEGGSEISSENEIDLSWVKLEVIVTPTTDGSVRFRYEKSDINGGTRNNGCSFFDDFTVEVVNQPTK